MDPHLQDELYAVVGHEVAEKLFHPGPMARAVAESKGNRALIEGLYIKFRVEELYRKAEREAAAAEEQAQAQASSRRTWMLLFAFLALVLGVIGMAWMQSSMAPPPSTSRGPGTAKPSARQTPPISASRLTEAIPESSFEPPFDGRSTAQRSARLKGYGGNDATEASVERALEWLAKNQLPDGTWSLMGPFSEAGGVENKVSATAMALLAFQGAGHSHNTGKHKAIVAKAWDALRKLQNDDGYFECDAAHHHRLYAQAQATIAACEIYGMTKDEAFRPIAQKAIDFAIKAQAPEGGWRYEPEIDSDMSVTGWYITALRTGRKAGLEINGLNTEAMTKFLDSVEANGGSHYMYKPGMAETPTMTAEGLLCRHYLGWGHDDERMKRGLDYVCTNTINYNDANVYYWYYATQVAFHSGGDHWKKWNEVMVKTVPQAQIKIGNEKGSWSPSGDRWGNHGGRLYVTCLHIYMLEAYYRHVHSAPDSSGTGNVSFSR